MGINPPVLFIFQFCCIFLSDTLKTQFNLLKVKSGLKIKTQFNDISRQPVYVHQGSPTVNAPRAGDKENFYILVSPPTCWEQIGSVGKLPINGDVSQNTARKQRFPSSAGALLEIQHLGMCNVLDLKPESYFATVGASFKKCMFSRACVVAVGLQENIHLSLGGSNSTP